MTLGMYILSFFKSTVSSWTSSILGLLVAPYSVLVKILYKLYVKSSSYYLNWRLLSHEHTDPFNILLLKFSFFPINIFF